MATVLLTDIAWPDCQLEEELLAATGHKLIWRDTNARSEGHVLALCREHQPDAIMTCWAPVSEASIDSVPNLRLIQRLGIGLDNIDVEAATRHGCWVANVPGYCAEEVSDHAVAMLMSLARDLPRINASVRSGIWDPALVKARRVCSLTIGLLGYGSIAQAIARKLNGLGCSILAHNRSGVVAGPARYAPLDEMLATSDAVIVLAPLNAGTRHLLDEAAFAQMRTGSFLINVSRGAIVSNDALIRALADGRIAGAGLDVIDGEPDIPPLLLADPRVIVTPHVAFSSAESLIDMKLAVCEEVARVLGGEPPRQACNRLQETAY
ncbi:MULTISPECIES: C-terminal binding protein [Sphingomonas]|jgi:D-3-phosphoglycerate dehydrogenase|uniref:Hydroxyacid dehydrogenase n=1 Tax=Sphingomonas turrisvirgatae TaxID=1888892 RepID=A0A1E3LYV4_9SPHN|nr:C-terminal binding protein [Sphingomonas turrisvirgatae]ODP38931.1 hypothetical protein BFL28_12795 [Sphingomonas turrisvirgatae]